MKISFNWIRVSHIFGVVALILGIIDPLEGSVLIALGSILLVFSSYLGNDPRWKIFILASALILTGVSFLFYLSSRGGIGGNSELSWWYGILILPYPLGWLLAITMLIIRTFKKKSS
ncbi:MAG TPA: hypothetical protein VK213_14725 [Bacteroidales bacterium]|nr:hypothetical protein [Bacteroidales bacterium]